jgi:hypothetical protein
MPYGPAKELTDAKFPNIRVDEYLEHRVGSQSDDYGGSSDYWIAQFLIPASEY